MDSCGTAIVEHKKLNQIGIVIKGPFALKVAKVLIPVMSRVLANGSDTGG